jgi:Family of unknown function (DUF5670)
MLGLLWGVVGLLVVLWLIGFILHVAGGLIHMILLLAIALAIYNFAMNRDAGQP